MLKLLKHGLKESYFEILVLNGLLIALSLLGFAMIRLQMRSLFVIFWLAWIFVLLAAGFILLRNIIKTFHTQFFTNRGYLTLTTPISIDKLLLSKIIINMLWIFVTTGGMLLSIFIVLAGIMDDLKWISIFFADSVVLLWELFTNSPWNFIKGVVYTLGSVLCSLMLLLLVLTLSNTGIFRKHRTLAGIGLCLIIWVIYAQINISINNADIFFIFDLIVSVGIYFLARWFITSKLELE